MPRAVTLAAAAHLNRFMGFRRERAHPGKQCAVDVIEEKYVPFLDVATNVRVRSQNPAAAEARTLLTAVDEYQTGLYPAESNHLLSVEASQQANVTFLIADVEGEPAGCGAFVSHGDYAEIKRMFVAYPFRGWKVGRRILDELESRMLAAGITIARLETGVLQREAIGLYEKAGYRQRGPFGEYREDPLSVFMEKRLT